MDLQGEDDATIVPRDRFRLAPQSVYNDMDGRAGLSTNATLLFQAVHKVTQRFEVNPLRLRLNGPRDYSLPMR